jgi:hypothetical protein
MLYASILLDESSTIRSFMDQVRCWYFVLPVFVGRELLDVDQTMAQPIANTIVCGLLERSIDDASHHEPVSHYRITILMHTFTSNAV